MRLKKIAKRLFDWKLQWWLMSCFLLGVLGLFLGDFYLYLVCVGLIMAMAATALNLIVGYGGMVSFGHGAFMGVGGYTVALLIIHTGTPTEIALVTGPFSAALIALIIGYFCVRLHGILFAMLTLAFSMMLYAVVYQWYSFTGGDNGIVGLPALISSLGNYYLFVVIITITCLMLMWRLVNSPFGRTLSAIQQNIERPSFIGINVRRYQIAMFTISGFFCGIAGALFCLLDGQVFPSIMFWSSSAEILIMVLLGGMLSFFGPSLGAALIIILKHMIGAYTVYWMAFLGIALLAITLFRPEGIYGFLEEKARQLKIGAVNLGDKLWN